MLSQRILRRIILALVSLAVAGSMAPSRPVRAEQARTIRITAFYTVTKAAYRAWTAKTPAPVRTSAFPKGTADVGYYLHYRGVVAHKTSYQVVIYDRSGAVYITGNKHTLSFTDGEVANYFGGGDPFDTGPYRMDLLVNGIVAASSAFAVGAGTASAASISTDRTIGPRVDAFYAITLAAYRAWTTHAPPPPATRAFPRGTTAVGFYISYEDMYAKRTSFQVVIYDQTGAPYATGNTHVFPYVRGDQLSYFGGTSPFDDGRYRMDLIVNGIVVHSVTFTVGG